MYSFRESRSPPVSFLIPIQNADSVMESAFFISTGSMCWLSKVRNAQYVISIVWSGVSDCRCADVHRDCNRNSPVRRSASDSTSVRSALRSRCPSIPKRRTVLDRSFPPEVVDPSVAIDVGCRRGTRRCGCPNKDSAEVKMIQFLLAGF